MSSLRKKCLYTKKSDTHLKAVTIYKQSEKKQIGKRFENSHKSNMLTIEKVFRTVYKIVKTIYFVDLPN